ncbi:MAG TPA: hypothetical protein VHF25_16405 [Nitriliruptorales bacterium]|nr:hypothetical protein [Nitriliruptorales bacterium]
MTILPGAGNTYERRVSAALLAAGDHAVAARWTAAYLLGIVDRPAAGVELLVPYGKGVPDLGSHVHVSRSRTITDREVVRARHLPCTSAERSFCDLAEGTRTGVLRGHLIDANQRGLVRYPRVLDKTFALRGSPGMPRLRTLLHELAPEACDSIFVYHVRGALTAAGMAPDPVPAAVTARNGVVVHPDITYQPYRVGVECEGFGAHNSRRHLDRDIRRRNTLRGTGYAIIWVGWERFEHDLDGFLAEVRDELVARGWPG